MKNYYVYILTNKNKTVLYTGVTNDLKRRLHEHMNGIVKGFTSKYKCRYILFYEIHNNINEAIEREKELKGWRRSKKENLIYTFNPDWKFLNELIFEKEL
jgi:putative endonuclease